MTKAASTLALLAALATPAAAADGSGIVEEMAERALARGYGAMCSLDHKPVARGGYFPCLDFGPYRYVSGYGKVYGLVVQKDREPFLVMSGPKGNASFIFDGPWKEDMPARMVMWWNETVEGTAARHAAEEAAEAERKAAEDYIRSLRGENPPAESGNEATAHVPASAPPPGGGTEEISLDIMRLLQTR